MSRSVNHHLFYSFLRITAPQPYIYEFKTYAKGRWIGKSLLDVLTSEFGGFDSVYWENAIKDSNILVNNAPTSKSYIVRNSDELLHRTHRHEPPVFGQITLVDETDELVAVSKPASMPMHPCGGYKYNTLLTILAEEPLIPNQPQLFTVHRLDRFLIFLLLSPLLYLNFNPRVTSGLVILAKSTVAANNISKEIRSNQTEKVGQTDWSLTLLSSLLIL
jgi:23S rRNA-/tRNA-specific pseudouridylate synthase